MTNSIPTASPSPAGGHSTQNSGVNPELEPTVPALDPAPDALIGRKIGHFLIESRLGTGAMATVYSATDQILNRQVALKVLLPGADLVVRERFRQEARTVSGLTHPHIVRTLQVGQTDADGITYIAMELVEGVSLADLLETHRQLSPADSCRLIEPIARALAYAHSQQVIHRDVKPSNVLLRRVTPGTVNSIQIAALDYPVVPLLSDFGIALAADSPELTAAGRTIGTPTYMAPEQCSGSRTIDGRADIYALGTVLYRCLAGRPPFVGSTTQVLHAHVYEALTMPEPVLRTLPPMVFTVLQHTLAKDPDERYGDAAKLAQDLARTALSITKGWPQEEFTATMEMLPPTTVTDAVETMRVLVPAPAPKGPASRPAVAPVPYLPPHEHKVPRDRPAPPSQSSNLWRRLLGVGVALLIGLLLVAFGIMLIVTGVPFDFANGRATATPVALVGDVPTLVTTVAPTTTAPGGDGPPATATELPAVAPSTSISEATATTEAPTATVEPATATVEPPAATATLTNTVVANVAITSTRPVTTAPASSAVQTAWEDTLALYETREWDLARDNLLLLFRQEPAFHTGMLNRGDRTVVAILQETLLQQPTAALWQQGRDLFDAKTLEQTYVDILLGLATQASRDDNTKAAIENFKEIVALRPNDNKVAALLSATQQYADAKEENVKAEARTVLGNLHRDYANELAGGEAFCPASEQLQAADTFLEAEDLSERLQIYQKECDKRLAATGGQKLLKDLTGALIYSTQVGKRYQIYRQPLILEAKPELLVNDGAQPQLARNGRWLAFYNQQDGIQGLSGFDLQAGLAADDRSLRYSSNVEDSRDSPPSWSPVGDRLVFATTRDSDRKSRILLQAAASDVNPVLLAQGEDPAWSPINTGENWIVYSGRGREGTQLGLWLASDNGQEFRPLTDVEGDRRPAWSADGATLLFMSQRRHNNWEIYQLTLATREVKRLTDDPAQDGLPTISPDGKYAAFVSDRGNQWQLWVLPLAEREAKAVPVATIQGELTNWLEHTIQWVN